MIAFKKVFTNTKIYNCYFHFSQNIWSNIQKNGMVSKYKSNKDFCIYIKMMLSIAFVPKYKQVEEYNKLKNSYIQNFKEKSEINILIYFENNFINNNLRNICDWSCSERVILDIPLTSNICEGFNRFINSLLKQCYPSLAKPIMILRTQDHLQDKSISEAIMLQSKGNYKTKRKLMNLKRIIENY
ncbi:hypothetical protein DMUE_5077, partial [Dictyocoela muelleri]